VLNYYSDHIAANIITIDWEIIPLDLPTVSKKCSTCKNNEFECSKKFRVNSNKKLSDVWLIYKCTSCNSTWNMTVISRKNLNKISSDLFDKYQQNNIDLISQYAFDKGLLKKNKVIIIPPLIQTLGPDIKEIINYPSKYVDLNIKLRYPLNISVKKILKEKLSITVRFLEEMLKQNVFIFPDNHNNTIFKVLINLENFRKYYYTSVES